MGLIELSVLSLASDDLSGKLHIVFWLYCFNALKALGKLFTTNVGPLDPGVNEYLARDSFYSVAPEMIVMAAMGVYALQGVEKVQECISSCIRSGPYYKGKLIQSC